MEDNLPLIQQMKDEMTQLKEHTLQTFYTCARYPSVKKIAYPGPDIQAKTITYYTPGQWSCMKGWFEPYDISFRGKIVDHKVFEYSKFSNTMNRLKKDIGEEFTMIIPK